MFSEDYASKTADGVKSDDEDGNDRAAASKCSAVPSLLFIGEFHWWSKNIYAAEKLIHYY